MQSSEQLREALVELQRENYALGIEKAHANLLIRAVEKLLGDEGSDPFAGVFTALREVFDYSAAVVLSESKDGAGLECIVADPPELVDSQWVPGPFLGKVLGGRVATTVTNEALEEWKSPPSPLLTPRQPALYLPLKMGGVRGLMVLFRDADEEGFDRAHVALGRKFALLASLAFAARAHRQNAAESRRLRMLTERLQQSQAQLTHRANHDQLTELPNRAFMQELVDAALAACDEGGKVGLAFVDVDDFKKINDLYSHAVGDALLKRLAERINENIREGDVVGRISGDEFVILFRGCHSPAEIETVAERLLQQLKLPFPVGALDLSSSATIGIAFYPDHGSDYEALRRAADLAMYTAKAAAKGSVSYFTAEMGDAATAHMRLEQRLRQAVAQRQFRCAFQPKVDLVSMRIVGFEALARWIDSTGQVHEPASFINQAAEFGVLDDIALIGVDDCLRSIGLLDAQFGRRSHFSINISAKQVSDWHFMRQLVSRLGDSGFPERFMLEVTEDAFVEPDILRARILPMLRAMRIRLSIDDFGRGYSSLSTLTEVPAHELKVDRSFITAIHKRPRSQSVLKAVESLGGALGMSVVAEGIETQAEFEYILANTSIRIGQGFLFARPQFVEDLVGSALRLRA